MPDDREEERRHRELLESQFEAAQHVIQTQQRAAEEVTRSQQATAAQFNTAQSAVTEQIKKTKGLAAWLHNQIQDGDIVEGLDRIVKNGGNLDRVDEVGDTLLTVAVRDNLPLPMTLLLDRGANPNALNGEGCAPLHIAAQFGRVKEAQLLLETGASIEEKDSDLGLTALGFATKFGQIDLAQFLIDQGSNPHHISCWGCSLLFFAFGTLRHSETPPENSYKVAKLLIQHGVDVNIRCDAGLTALGIAVRESDLDDAMMLLDSGAYSSTPDDLKSLYKLASTEEMKSLLKVHGAKGCFIATAVCDPSDPCLVVLRRFRDERLHVSSCGNFVVKIYYRLSPPLARWLSRHDSARTTVRERLVRPFARWVER